MTSSADVECRFTYRRAAGPSCRGVCQGT